MRPPAAALVAREMAVWPPEVVARRAAAVELGFGRVTARAAGLREAKLRGQVWARAAAALG